MNNHNLIASIIIVSIAAIIGYTILFGSANVHYDETFIGDDVVKFETRTDTPEFADNAQVRNADTVNYRSTIDWGKMESGESGQVSESSFEFTGGEHGTYKIEYSGSGYKNKFVATGATGDFAGSSKVVTVETGVPETDALVLMDGNMTYYGKIVNGHTGRPVTERETYSVGNLTIQSYFNASISDEKTTDENWLGSCGESYKDAILDPGGSGVYVQPYGHYIDDSGIIHKDMKYWKMNETTHLLELIPRTIESSQ